PAGAGRKLCARTRLSCVLGTRSCGADLPERQLVQRDIGDRRASALQTRKPLRDSLPSRAAACDAGGETAAQHDAVRQTVSPSGAGGRGAFDDAGTVRGTGADRSGRDSTSAGDRRNARAVAERDGAARGRRTTGAVAYGFGRDAPSFS